MLTKIRLQFEIIPYHNSINSAKIETRTNITTMVKLVWKNDEITNTSWKVYGEDTSQRNEHFANESF